ncbi:MAG TPA: sugar phosphate nucleotidyltransferase [Methylomirabilota bacterium]|nr:sugar phosphate nucleotidyltransferase [Methylomirabilota bacterium]
MDTSGRQQETRGTRSRAAGTERWAVVLAGGDGTRLRGLTRGIAGDDRPKQFCSLLAGHDTLLAETRQRIALQVSPARTLFSVTSGHGRFYAPLLADVGSRHMVVQPENRGTAPAILYALLRIAVVAPDDPVAIFPSDHHVSDDGAFMAHVGAAFDLVRARPDLVVLLGITPDRPETEYGWIERGESVAGRLGWGVHRVRGFVEKPARELARTLLEGGALWNSFVMIGRVAVLLDLIGRTLPDLGRAFRPLRRTRGTPGEAAVARAIYRRLPSTDFSRRVLGESPAQLAVLPVRGVEWSDLGSPDRVLALRRRTAVPWDELAAGPALVAGVAS